MKVHTSFYAFLENFALIHCVCAANALPISSFNEDSVDDDELLTLLPFLEAIHGLQDVRSVLGLRT